MLAKLIVSSCALISQIPAAGYPYANAATTFAGSRMVLRFLNEGDVAGAFKRLNTKGRDI